MADDVALLRRELEETRHRLILTQQALTVAEQTLEDIATRHEPPAASDGQLPQHARDGLRRIHAVLRQIDRDAEKGS